MSNDIVGQWFAKADSDFKIATDSIKTEEPVNDMICFHAQQCVEKYLKGFLVFHDIDIEKTHNLTTVLNACIKVDTAFALLRDKNVEILTPYATTYRYPDDFYMPTIEETKDALATAEFVRQFVRRAIDIKKL